MCQMTYPNHEELIDAINSTLQKKKKNHQQNKPLNACIQSTQSSFCLSVKLFSFFFKKKKVGLGALHGDKPREIIWFQAIEKFPSFYVSEEQGCMQLNEVRRLQ